MKIKGFLKSLSFGQSLALLGCTILLDTMGNLVFINHGGLFVTITWALVASILFLGALMLTVVKGIIALRKPRVASTISSPSSGVMVFRNPANGYVEASAHAGLWCLLFGCFYFAYKGVWSHAVIAFFLACVTAGLSWLIYPFFARQIIERQYLRRGWQRV